ncbi:MAG: permease-like cell division protein FtsX [Nitrospiria bacterium]
MKSRRRAATVGVAITSAIVLTLAGGCWLAAWNAWNLMRAWRADIKVVVYVRDDATADQIDLLRHTITDHHAVRGQRFVSKSEAQEAFLQSMGLDRSVLEGLGDNPFPAWIEVSLTDEAQTPDRMASLASAWAAGPGVEEVRYGEALIRDLALAARAVWVAGALLGGALAAGVAVVIGVMIQMSLRTRHDEVSLLRLLGASEGVVIRPFVFEGLVIGTVGGALASAVLGAGWGLAQSRVVQFEGLLAFWMNRLVFPLEFVPLLIGLGAIVGGVGSLAAVWRISQPVT